MEAAAVDRRVSLTIPAKPDYVVLARLALSAVCRLAPLELEAAADLKLAITEAASFLMGGDRRAASRDGDDEVPHMTFTFDLLDEEERELSRAIIGATADDCTYADGTMRLTKRLGLTAE
jgi:hypothetical protein